MDIDRFQKRVLESFNKMAALPQRTAHTKQSALIHLIEEVEEVARELTNEYHRPEKFDTKNLGKELADLMMYVVLLAKMYNIEISNEMAESIKRVESNTKKLRMLR